MKCPTSVVARENALHTKLGLSERKHVLLQARERFWCHWPLRGLYQGLVLGLELHENSHFQRTCHQVKLSCQVSSSPPQIPPHLSICNTMMTASTNPTAHLRYKLTLEGSQVAEECMARSGLPVGEATSLRQQPVPPEPPEATKTPPRGRGRGKGASTRKRAVAVTAEEPGPSSFSPPRARSFEEAQQPRTTNLGSSNGGHSVNDFRTTDDFQKVCSLLCAECPPSDDSNSYHFFFPPLLLPTPQCFRFIVESNGIQRRRHRGIFEQGKIW